MNNKRIFNKHNATDEIPLKTGGLIGFNVTGRKTRWVLFSFIQVLFYCQKYIDLLCKRITK